LCSGPSDHVFVNFVDHGAPGLLAFPSDELYADDLERALRIMAVNRQFSRVSKTETIVAESFLLLYYINASKFTECTFNSKFDRGDGI
jgi:hypothetical protein